MTVPAVVPPEMIAMPKEILALIGVVGSGLFLKIVYDWFLSGRMQPGVFMTINECKQNRLEGCSAFRTHSALTDQKVSDLQKQVDLSSAEFKKTATDIADIKTSLAVIASVIEHLPKSSIEVPPT